MSRPSGGNQELRPGYPEQVTLLRRPVSWGLLKLVWLYQRALSPYVGGHCKYLPTCSQYFVDAVTRKGALAGTLLGLWRICRCNPFSRGGYDPVR